MCLMGLDKGDYWVHTCLLFYLGDLSNDLNNINAWCYIGEIL